VAKLWKIILKCITWWGEKWGKPGGKGVGSATTKTMHRTISCRLRKEEKKKTRGNHNINHDFYFPILLFSNFVGQHTSSEQFLLSFVNHFVATPSSCNLQLATWRRKEAYSSTPLDSTGNYYCCLDT